MPERRHPNKGPWIAELREGERFIGFYLSREAEFETFRDPSRGQFLRLRLADRSGEVDARIWEAAEDYSELIGEPHVVKVEGEVETYIERPQARVLQLRLAGEGEFDLGDLLRTTERDPETMLQEIDRAIAGTNEPHLKALLEGFFADEAFRNRFQTAPAAKRIHHAYTGGLLEHTYETLLLSRPLLELYPELDRDLLIGGILLHDIGKLQAYGSELEIEQTDEGRLLGHVLLGAERVSNAIQAIPDFPESLALELRHLIISHHGRLEWGSPRRPKTLEAIALHLLENLDVQVNRFKLLLEPARMAGQRWTQYDRLLGRSLFASPGETEGPGAESAYGDEE